ncbi:RHS repeat-associated core domain-containing protein, partial [Endothiovibrio diazotrophicus]
AAGHTTLAYYDPLTNRPERITDPLGRETVLDYDNQGRLIRATNAANESATVAYTDRGQIQTITDPAGNAWTFAYDDFGNLTAATDPEGHTARYRYDAASRVIEATDPLGRSTRYAYDPMDRVTQVIDPKGHTTTLAYRPDGRLATVTDAKGAVIESNEYDVLGRLTTRTDALGHTEQFTYDKNDNLLTYTDAAGQLTTFGYDALDRLIGLVDADGRSTEYQYDLAGNLVWVADSASGDTRYDYDELDRLTREISPRGTVEYAYDAAGQLTARRVNGLSLTTYGYDPAGRVTTIEHDGRRALYRYDAAGRLSEKELPNGIVQRYAYSPAGDLLTIAYLDASGSEVDRIDYEYDGAGNRIRRHRMRASSTPETLFNGVYDDANRMLSYNGYALSYDDNGNLVSRETEQGAVDYTWDARGQLVAIDGPNGTARFKYDHQGRRIERTVNGVTTGFLYDGAQAVAELAGSALGATYHTGLMIDEVLGRYAAAGDKQLLSDALGSVVGLADEGGWVSDEYAYSPFGESVHTGADAGNSLGYTGREDDGTGLYYYRARYYDPGLKRFISSDPIGLLGGVNSYAYVSNDPLNFYDPYGLLRFNFDQFANQVEANRFDMNAVLGTLVATEAFGTMPKTPKELRAFGPKNKINPLTGQLSRWSGRFGTRALRVLGRTTFGIAVGTLTTGALVFEGFYDWGVIGKAAWDALSFDDNLCR